MRIRTGVDVVNIKRLRKLLRSEKEKFLRRVFTKKERSYCEKKKDSIPHYAARFAAKEAVFKALSNAADKINFQDIEITNKKNGKPELRINPKKHKALKMKKSPNVVVSLSHEHEFAVAFVIIT